MKKMCLTSCLVLVFGLTISIDAISLKRDAVEDVVGLTGDIVGKIVTSSEKTFDEAFDLKIEKRDEPKDTIKLTSDVEGLAQGVITKTGEQVFESYKGFAENIISKTGEKVFESSKNTLDFAQKIVGKTIISKMEKRDEKEAPKARESFKIDQTEINQLFNSVLEVYGDDLVELANEFLKKINLNVTVENEKNPIKREAQNETPKEEPKNVVDKLSTLNYIDNNLKLNDKYTDKFMKAYGAFKRSLELTESTGKQLEDIKNKSLNEVFAPKLNQTYGVLNKTVVLTEKELSQIKIKSIEISRELEMAFKKYVEELKQLSSDVKQSEKRQAMDGSSFTDKYLKLNDKYAKKFMKPM